MNICYSLNKGNSRKNLTSMSRGKASQIVLLPSNPFLIRVVNPVPIGNYL